MTGLQFEREVLQALSSLGYWAYRCNPDKQGSQPFDIIACKGDDVSVYDCKVISTDTQRFDFKRIETNQESSFAFFLSRANPKECGFLVWLKGKVYYIPYELTRNGKSIKLTEDLRWML